jgi:hypothetical protein
VDVRPGSPQERVKEKRSAEAVPPRRHDDDLGGAKLTDEPGDIGRILSRDSRVRLADDIRAKPRPDPSHRL